MARQSRIVEPTTLDVTHTLGSAKPTTCGKAFTILTGAYSEAVASKFAADGCQRLPRHNVDEHKGHVVGSKPRGLMSPAQRKAAASKRTAAVVAKPKASKIVLNRVVAGFRVVVREDGTVTSTAVEPKAPAAKVAANRPARSTPRPKAGKVKTVRPVKADRVVAAPAPVTKRGRGAHGSGRPSARLA
jgi:hypothetical protein